MANLSKNRREEEQIFGEVTHHYQIGFDETDRRTTGNNRIGSISFNEADELFRSWLDEENWPYEALLFDPRIFTFIFEKTSRLIANKPKGRLTPREGSDMLAAKINNALLDYQWDMANMGGTMLSKWALMDINARKYGASFALANWRYEKNSKDKVVFDGPEFKVVKNRDVAHDLAATSIEECNWFQVRQYFTIQDLRQVNDANRESPIYKNLKTLEEAVAMEGENMGGGDSRGTNWLSRNRSISGLEQDPVGRDRSFPTVEITTEYRKDRWITFADKHGVILRDIPNPYENNEIPVVMLKYYPIDDDLYGLSEIEPVKGLQKAINALLCQYVDEINQKLNAPVAIGPGVRQHTLEWGKGARWIMNNPNQDYRLVESNSNAAQFFQSTYSVLVSAMLNALGESSLGVSNQGPFNPEKTATEVKELTVQRNSRDQYNQNFLAEAIKRQMMLWHSMNQKLLFSDEEAEPYILRIVGKDAIEYFDKEGLGDTELDTDRFSAIQEMDRVSGRPISDVAPEELFSPKKPVVLNGKQIPKFNRAEDGSAEIYIEAQDIKGTFDFSVDVESMAVSADDQKKQGRQQAVTLLTTNPNVIQLLASEKVKPKFKDLFVQWLEDAGFNDADRYFEKMPDQAEAGMDPQALAEQLGGRSGRPRSPEGSARGPIADAGSQMPGNPGSQTTGGIGQQISQALGA